MRNSILLALLTICVTITVSRMYRLDAQSPTITGTPFSKHDQIVFESDEGAKPRISTINADGSNLHLLTHMSAYTPRWSPDGQHIAFTSVRDENWEIYVMNTDGSNERNLTNNPAGDYHPVWSPNAKAIAFLSNRDGYEDIFVMNADGSQQHHLTLNDATYSKIFAWSPDSKHIVF